jgi:hypothetical protein
MSLICNYETLQDVSLCAHGLSVHVHLPFEPEYEEILPSSLEFCQELCNDNLDCFGYYLITTEAEENEQCWITFDVNNETLSSMVNNTVNSTNTTEHLELQCHAKIFDSCRPPPREKWSVGDILWFIFISIPAFIIWFCWALAFLAYLCFMLGACVQSCWPAQEEEEQSVDEISEASGKECVIDTDEENDEYVDVLAC